MSKKNKKLESLTELTEEQVAMLPHIADKWINVGISTDPTNREEAVRGVNLAYEAAGLKPPKHFLWLRSPIEGCVAAAFVEKHGDTVFS